MDFESLRVSFVLGSQFPTPRAYGITTRETLGVLKKHSIDFKVFCLKSSYTDEDFDLVLRHIVNFQIISLSRLLRFFSNFGNSKLNYLIWRLSLFLDVYGNIRKIREYSPHVIWTRDPLIAYILLKKFSNIKVILEVHENVGKIFYKKLGFSKRVKFFPINKENYTFLQETFGDKINFEIMPMGVRHQMQQRRLDVDTYINHMKNSNQKLITIGYVGAFEPSGYSKGIEDLVFLAKYSQEKHLNYKVKLVGASPFEFQKYTQIKAQLGLNDNYLVIIPHVSHSKALMSMSQCDILILPAYKSKRYMGMPIKLLEYLISGKLTFVGECDLYRNILPSNLFQLIYPSSEPHSLSNFIQSFINDNDLREILTSSIAFASEYTWERRTLKMLNSALNLDVLEN